MTSQVGVVVVVLTSIGIAVEMVSHAVHERRKRSIERYRAGQR